MTKHLLLAFNQLKHFFYSSNMKLPEVWLVFDDISEKVHVESHLKRDVFPQVGPGVGVTLENLKIHGFEIRLKVKND